VVDASVAVKWLLPENHHAESLALLRAYVDGRTQLIAPPLLAHEVALVIARRFERKDLTMAGAQRAFDVFRTYRPALVDQPELSRDALELALRYHLGLGDCVYIALALRYRCNLVTADARLVRAAARHFSFVRPVRP